MSTYKTDYTKNEYLVSIWQQLWLDVNKWVKDELLYKKVYFQDKSLQTINLNPFPTG